MDDILCATNGVFVPQPLDDKIVKLFKLIERVDGCPYRHPHDDDCNCLHAEEIVDSGSSSYKGRKLFDMIERRVPGWLTLMAMQGLHPRILTLDGNSSFDPRQLLGYSLSSYVSNKIHPIVCYYPLDAVQMHHADLYDDTGYPGFACSSFHSCCRSLQNCDGFGTFHFTNTTYGICLTQWLCTYYPDDDDDWFVALSRVYLRTCGHRAARDLCDVTSLASSGWSTYIHSACLGFGPSLFTCKESIR